MANCAVGDNPFGIGPTTALSDVEYDYGRVGITITLTEPSTNPALCGSESITTTVVDDIASSLDYLASYSETAMFVFFNSDPSIINESRTITYKYLIDQNGFYIETEVVTINFVERNDNAPAFSDAMETEI